MAKEGSDFNAATEPLRLAAGLLADCNTLLSELDAFRSFIADEKRNNPILSISAGGEAVDVRQFHSTVLSELKSLRKVGEFLNLCASKQNLNSHFSNILKDISAFPLSSVS